MPASQRITGAPRFDDDTSAGRIVASPRASRSSTCGSGSSTSDCTSVPASRLTASQRVRHISSASADQHSCNGSGSSSQASGSPGGVAGRPSASSTSQHDPDCTSCLSVAAQVRPCRGNGGLDRSSTKGSSAASRVSSAGVTYDGRVRNMSAMAGECGWWRLISPLRRALPRYKRNSSRAADALSTYMSRLFKAPAAAGAATTSSAGTRALSTPEAWPSQASSSWLSDDDRSTRRTG